MKYRGYSQDLIPNIPDNCKELIQLIERVTGVDITTKTRKAKYIYARKIYYKILHTTDNMTVRQMTDTLIQTHATALHALNNFKFDYKHNEDFRKTYDKIKKIYQGNEKEVTELEELQIRVAKYKQEIQEQTQTIDELRN
jgi:predicted RNase H-like nuclease (RuvC/YqgF family)